MRKILFVSILILVTMCTNVYADIDAKFTYMTDNIETDYEYILPVPGTSNSFYVNINGKNYNMAFPTKKVDVNVWRNKKVREINLENIDFELKLLSMEYVKAGDKYLAYEDGRITSPGSYYLETYLYIYDSELNLIKTEDFGGGVQVSDVGYYDGKYYCSFYEIGIVRRNGEIEYIREFNLADRRDVYNRYGAFDDITFHIVTVESTDLENWTVVSEANGEEAKVFNERWENYRFDSITCNFTAIPRQNDISVLHDNKIALYDDNIFSDVVYEKYNERNIYKQAGEWYIFFSNDVEKSTNVEDYKLHFSSDGIYSVQINWNDYREDAEVFDGGSFKKYNTGDYLIETDEELVIYFYSSRVGAIRIPKEEFYSEMEKLKTAPYVRLNGTFLGFEKAPVIKEGRTLVPMRFLFEQMGADVSWDDATQTATARFNDKTVKIRVNSTTATVNGEPKTLDVPAELMEDKTMIPLRFVSENLGFNVSWNDASRIADITG